MIEFLLAGISLGFVAGISPGPLLILVITETIKYNRKEGIKMALAPLISDLPIVLLSVFIVHKLSNSNLLLAIISLFGVSFLIYLAWENVKTKSIKLNIDKGETKTLRKGIIVNFLSPHPYLFWMLVGAPLLMKAFNQSLISSILFIIGFYTFLVGSKIGIAFITEKTKNILSSNIYLIIVRILGFVLLVFAFILIKDGLKFLNLF